MAEVEVEGDTIVERLFDFWTRQPPGLVISRESLCEAAGLTEGMMSSLHSAQTRARRRLLRERRRTVRYLRGRGWCVARADDQVDLALAHQEKAHALVATSVDLVQSTDVRELVRYPERFVTQVGLILSWEKQQIDSLDMRTQAIETTLERVRGSAERNAAKMEEQQERLARIEADLREVRAKMAEQGGA